MKKTEKMSRSKILEAISRNKPAAINLPEIKPDDFREDIDLLKTFIVNAGLSASKIVVSNSREDFDIQLREFYPDVKKICSFVGEWFKGTIDINTIRDPRELEGLDLLVINGTIGVAENGAIWIPEGNMGLRALPFITRHLVILLDKQRIVQNMHEAYDLLDDYEQGFGVFIAGPSKTADIEQSLVIGAQGPLSTTIFLV